MAPGAPQQAFSAWDAYHDRIVKAIKAMYADLSKEYEDILLKEIQSKFPSNFVSDTKSVAATVKRIADPTSFCMLRVISSSLRTGI